MCDYSLHAQATRPARVGETLVSTTFQRNFYPRFRIGKRARRRRLHASRTELAFVKNVKYESRFLAGQEPSGRRPASSAKRTPALTTTPRRD